MFGGFTEGLQLFASFAMLMNFPRFNKMKGMGQIVSLERARREPALRGDGQALPRLQRRDRRCVTQAVADDIVDCCKTVVGLEDRFIDLAFEAGEVQGMTADDIKRYIRFIADWRLRQLELPEVYGVKENPLPWLQSAAVRRRARQLLRGARHRVLQGRHHAGAGTATAASGPSSTG